MGRNKRLFCLSMLMEKISALFHYKVSMKFSNNMIIQSLFKFLIKKIKATYNNT